MTRPQRVISKLPSILNWTAQVFRRYPSAHGGARLSQVSWLEGFHFLMRGSHARDRREALRNPTQRLRKMESQGQGRTGAFNLTGTRTEWSSTLFFHRAAKSHPPNSGFRLRK